MPAAALPRLRGPRPRYPGEFLLAMGRNPLDFFRRLHAEHGDVVRLAVGPRTFVLVADPDLAREVLVTQQKRFVRGYAHRGLRLLLGDGLLTSEGEFHRRQRRIAQPAFHRERIARYAESMVEAAARWDARWRALPADADGRRPVDMHAEMMALTLGIAGETLFGARVEGLAAEVAGAMADALKVGPIAFLPYLQWALRLPLPVVRRFHRARARLDAIVYGIIAERRRAIAERGSDDRGDLLSMLLVATDPEETDGAPMSDAQLRDEVMTIFLAGHETTASALTFTWYLLARDPHAAAALRAELDAALGTGAARRAPTVDDVARLPFARAVVAESMRLYPPAYAVGRICAERTELGGHVIEPAWGVITSPWLAHHDPRWWPEPETFRPERWLEPDQGERPRLAYFPFGAGSRICIGEQFAWTEAILVLATLFPRWDAALVPGPPMVPRGAITLRPLGGIAMALAPRGD